MWKVEDWHLQWGGQNFIVQRITQVSVSSENGCSREEKKTFPFTFGTHSKLHGLSIMALIEVVVHLAEHIVEQWKHVGWNYSARKKNRSPAEGMETENAKRNILRW